MTETTLQWIKSAEFFIVIILATLYGFGGISGKWKRRFVAPFVMLVSVSLFSWIQGKFNPLALLTPLLYIGVFHIGYGADKEITKWLKRSLYALAAFVAAIPLFMAMHVQFGIYIQHGTLCALTVPLGVKNYSGSARAEETTIAGLILLTPMMIV
ncbi:MAG: hypothetical protein KatS3mg087_1658 [Patescibacteria group bacterium]|nr:MAG: hypothetical protein KatS3mg087_1658 [Patescibacteria group bacterium]